MADSVRYVRMYDSLIHFETGVSHSQMATACHLDRVNRVNHVKTFNIAGHIRMANGLNPI
jgi:hypothetical protein